MSLLQASKQASCIDEKPRECAAEPQQDPSQQLGLAGRLKPSHLLRAGVLKRLERISTGRLKLVEHNRSISFGRPDAELVGDINVRDPRFYSLLAWGGGIGAAEGYIRGYWDSEDLTASMRVLAQNMEALTNFEKGVAGWLKPLRVAANWLRRNTRAGSQRNISAHYDLSNEFFGLMLDPTMTYSSGVFPAANSSLEEASTEKYDRICRKLNLDSSDHVLEIGTGWGGFATHAARHYGCRITTTTISSQQYDYAQRRFQSAGLERRVTLLKKDYRDLTGMYDKLVSIEMIEAVGKKFLPTYFAKCSDLLKEDGAMLLQAITIPDHRFPSYCRSVDFIQRYIFPGGFLPSIGAIANCVGRQTDLRFFHAEDFGQHYAYTLKHWRRNFWNRLDDVRKLGFDERFVRTWEYYLCYCEAGFQERQIGVSQLLLTKPMSRLDPVLSTPVRPSG